MAHYPSHPPLYSSFFLSSQSSNVLKPLVGRVACCPWLHEGQGKEIDFWLVRRPAFLQAPEMANLAKQIPQPSAAVVSTDSTFITFMKLRLEFVLEGQFEAPTSTISDALAET